MSGAAATYSYDQADRLIKATAGVTTTTCAYNGDGLRMSKTVSGTAEAFTWDVAEGLPLLVRDRSTRYIDGPDGLPIEQIDGSGRALYYYQDQLGSTRPAQWRGPGRGHVHLRSLRQPDGDQRDNDDAVRVCGPIHR